MLMVSDNSICNRCARSALKARGNANNDWDVSLNLMKESGCLTAEKIPSREEVVRVFEELYVACCFVVDADAELAL